MSYVRPTNLPTFAAPPVTTVRLKMVFQPLQMPLRDVAKLIELYAIEYPNVEESASRPSPILRLSPAYERVRFELADSPSTSFFRLRNLTDSRSIEFQDDSFCFSWHKADSDDYPDYSNVRSEFLAGLEKLEEANEASGNDSITLAQCEIEYVNIEEVAADDPDAGLSSVLQMVAPAPRLDGFPLPNTAGYDTSFDFSNEDDVYARLQVRALARAGLGNQQRVRFRLRFVGDPFARLKIDERITTERVMEFFDEGHDSIVQAFDRFTSDESHDKWGRSK